jgi:glycosyltransferase involved in cell wall biosynthesis
MKMKVGVWLFEGFSPKEGGGFSYYDVLIRALDKYNFAQVDLVFLSSGSQVNGLQRKVLCIPKLRYRILILFQMINRIFPGRLTDKLNRTAEKIIASILIKNDIKLIFYPIQLKFVLTDFPFISNNWDIGHRSTFAFPELIYNGQFRSREDWYGADIMKALLVFCESETGKKELIRFSGISEDKVKVVPTFSGESTHITLSEDNQKKILAKYKLQKNHYFFYPAQFWAHKNHYGLLHAFYKIKKKHMQMKLVLTGSNKGNLSYVKKIAYQLDIEDDIVFCGFVSNDEIMAFYCNATALVMTTFFGPTNMPFLEALALDCPVLCSDLEGHREMLKDAARYFSPENHDEIAGAMDKILIPETRKNLQVKANHVRLENKFNIESALKEIDKHFTNLKNVRCCWE